MPDTETNDRHDHEPAFQTLGVGEQLLLWSTRKWLEDGKTSNVVETAFLDACGVAQVEAALAGFEGFVELLATTSRRVLGLRRPNCGRVSTDELSILTMIGAAYAGDRDHVEAAARWLVPTASGQRLVDHAMSLATALRRSGVAVSRRTRLPPADTGRGADARKRPLFQRENR